MGVGVRLTRTRMRNAPPVEEQGEAPESPFSPEHAEETRAAESGGARRSPGRAALKEAAAAGGHGRTPVADHASGQGQGPGGEQGLDRSTARGVVSDPSTVSGAQAGPSVKPIGPPWRSQPTPRSHVSGWATGVGVAGAGS